MNSLSFLIVDNARLLRVEFERRILQAGLDITPGEARALINVAAVDGSRQLEIAARMGVEPMTLCAYLDRLQALGLIDRSPCSTDRRAKRVTLTETSGAMIDVLRQEMQEILSHATEGISDDNNRLLHEMMAIMNGNLQSAGSTGSGKAEIHESR